MEILSKVIKIQANRVSVIRFVKLYHFIIKITFRSTHLETIATSNGAITNGDVKHAIFGKLGTPAEVALKADSLCKTYDGHHYAVKDVTFNTKVGEACGH